MHEDLPVRYIRRLETALTVFFNSSFVDYGKGLWGREDPFDVGGEYRALIGLPGGVKGPHMPRVLRANVHNMSILEGHGSDPDTFDAGAVYIMDSSAFPFTQAEVCMQFHDDAPGVRGPFPSDYHAYLPDLRHRGAIHSTQCPPNFVCGPPSVAVM